jgi:hypothetical protein
MGRPDHYGVTRIAYKSKQVIGGVAIGTAIVANIASGQRPSGAIGREAVGWLAETAIVGAVTFVGATAGALCGPAAPICAPAFGAVAGAAATYVVDR